MKYAELLEIARRLSPEERTANLRGLVLDPRFAAVIALIESLREAFVQSGSAQKMAPHHGSLAHCMGSIHALEYLAGQIKQISDAPAPTVVRDAEE